MLATGFPRESIFLQTVYRQGIEKLTTLVTMKKICLMMLMTGACVAWSPNLFANTKIKEALMSADVSVASGGIDSCVSQGGAILPKLRKWAGDNDPRLKARARTALGRITGQWASQTDVIWKRSLAEAVKESKATGKPILMLHLFGKLDEEFC